VGGAIADSAPTTEPNVIAFPSYGSSEYRPLSLAPLDDLDVLDEAQTGQSPCIGTFVDMTVRKHIVSQRSGDQGINNDSRVIVLIC
jgi:hypothetical protein